MGRYRRVRRALREAQAKYAAYRRRGGEIVEALIGARRRGRSDECASGHAEARDIPPRGFAGSSCGRWAA
jgi:hypothetical protein